jgi:hypothetical protein
MNLTRRQEKYIEDLIDLSEEVDGPIHYSLLADRLGVSPFTAYDMLRLLEEKGLVASEYHVPEGKSGPGRAERLFYPLKHRPHEWIKSAEENELPALSGEEWKQFVLERIRQGQIPDKELAQEVLARVPLDGPKHIQYCLEVLTVAALRLRQHLGRQRFLSYLANTLPSKAEIPPANLGLLGGFAFGFLAREKTGDREWSQMLLDHMVQFQEILHSLAPEERDVLTSELTLILAPLTAVSP